MSRRAPNWAYSVSLTVRFTAGVSSMRPKFSVSSKMGVVWKRGYLPGAGTASGGLGSRECPRHELH